MARTRGGQRVSRRTLLLLFPIACGALLMIVLAVSWPSSDAPKLGAVQPLPAPPPEKQAAENLLAAIRGARYGEVWVTLTPEAQQPWSEPKALNDFLGRKFAGPGISYNIGDVKRSTDGRSAVAPISITYGPGTLSGPPLRLVEQGGAWLVADLGAFGTEGPILDTPTHPINPELSVPIMTYHRMASELPADYQQRTLSVTTDDFRGQLEILSRDGYKTITVAQLYNAMYYGLPLPSKPIILVFDDGYEDTYLRALPLLREFGFSATIAMVTGFAGQPGYLTWEEVSQMLSAGIEFVSHTVNHTNLGDIPEAAARAELADSKRVLEEKLARPVQYLVYPYGEPFAAGSDEARATILRLLPEAGYAGALMTSSGAPYIDLQEAGTPYQLHRIPVSGGESVARFASTIGATP